MQYVNAVIQREQGGGKVAAAVVGSRETRVLRPGCRQHRRQPTAPSHVPFRFAIRRGCTVVLNALFLVHAFSPRALSLVPCPFSFSITRQSELTSALSGVDQRLAVAEGEREQLAAALAAAEARAAERSAAAEELLVSVRGVLSGTHHELVGMSSEQYKVGGLRVCLWLCRFVS